MSSLSMSPAQREQFLAGLHVGVLAIPDGARGPLTAPIWYGYRPGGEIEVVTGADSRKGKLLRVGVRVSFVAQTETSPYQYVSVEGPVTAVEPVRDREVVRALARRYLGEKGGDAYVAATWRSYEEDPNVLVRIKPERWLTVDYSSLASVLTRAD
ncbi:MAG: pyridoxamine 5'-phosphate oxidase family protein [Deltaproteobacteria bacterium]|nr:pyridoxamine 5'-phosphate oxidase family protein [Deltaproteobacteria bacterium]